MCRPPQSIKKLTLEAAPSGCCTHLHSRVPLPEITLPLTPSAEGLGPLRENHTFSKPMARLVLLPKKKNPARPVTVDRDLR